MVTGLHGVVLNKKGNKMTIPDTVYAPINKIKANPFNERKHTVDIHPLAQNMRKKGFWGTLLAREVKGGYEIAFGERRLKAAKMAGFKELPLQVKAMDDQEMKQNTVLENVNREDVDGLERGRHLLAYQKKYKVTDRTLAGEFTMPIGSISKLIAAANLNSNIQKQITAGDITWNTAVDAHRAGGDKLLKTAVKQKLSQEEIKDIGATIRAIPEEKERLVTGRVTPAELAVQRVTKAAKDPLEMAMEISRFIGKAGDAIKVYQENKKVFGTMETHIVAMAITTLGKTLKSKEVVAQWKDKLDL